MPLVATRKRREGGGGHRGSQGFLVARVTLERSYAGPERYESTANVYELNTPTTSYIVAIDK